MSKQEKNTSFERVSSIGHYTQWAAQFFTAAELTRRGYLVTFTLGNSPEWDMLIVSPHGKHFGVDVKGLKSPNFWLLGKHVLDDKEDLYFILVHVCKHPDPVDFFILNSSQAKKIVEEHHDDLKKRGREIKNTEYGFNFKKVSEYKNKWEALPK